MRERGDKNLFKNIATFLNKQNKNNIFSLRSLNSALVALFCEE
jgi:hypothetical protein